MLDQLVEDVVKVFCADPKNKVFATEDMLLASIKEEAGVDMTAEQLHSLIDNFSSGSLEDDEYETYDAAVYVCSVLASQCFGEDPDDEDEEVDYAISWIENSDGTYSAEVRPD